jgi:hypothetical protein
MFSLIIGLLSQFISLSIIVAVFDYGRKQTQNYISKRMSGNNEGLMYKYKEFLIASSSISIILAFFMGFSYGVQLNDKDPKTIPMKIMRNFGCAVLSMALLGITSYEIYLSVMFLKNKQHHSNLYIL